MSILIRGMEMPKTCDDCFLPLQYCPYAMKPNGECPLVPVPPHGRLIDADALADVFRGFIAMYDGCPFSQFALTDKARRDELQSALAEVINAPTIIPAEEGE